MKIALLNDLWLSIPPKKYGGAERVVYELTEGLAKKGHDVTLYATRESKVAARLVSVTDKPLFDLGVVRKEPETIYALLNLTELLKRADEYDIINYHMNVASDYIALPLLSHLKHKTIFTIHFAPPVQKGYPERDRLLREYRNLHFSSISNAAQSGLEYLNWTATAYDGVDINQFTFHNKPQDYFAWIGKFNPDKGTKETIIAAKKAGVRLKIAGTIDNLDERDKQYYEQEVKPLIDGKQIIYVGEVSGKKKDQFLGNAKAFLNTIQWNEPFGLVTIESMATGTPVIISNRGSAQELVVDGKTGYIVNTLDEMVEKIKQISTIDRWNCRLQAEKFSTAQMIDSYEAMYRRLIDKRTTNMYPFPSIDTPRLQKVMNLLLEKYQKPII